MLPLALFATANAASATIVNHSFEDPILSGDGSANVAPREGGAYSGWGFYKSPGGGAQCFGIENASGCAYNGAGGSSAPAGADGSNVVFLNYELGGETNIFQSVGALLPHIRYTPTVAIGQRLDRENGAATIALIHAAAGSGDAWGAGSILSRVTGVSTVKGDFQDFTVSVTTGATVADELFIGVRYVGDGRIQARVDNFRLDAQLVPEPGAAALLAVWALGILDAVDSRVPAGVGSRLTRRR